MRNITVSVPDEIYRQARVRAAERDQSLSALVAEFLAALSSEKSDTDTRHQELELLCRKITHFRMGKRPSRDQIHDRQGFR